MSEDDPHDGSEAEAGRARAAAASSLARSGAAGANLLPTVTEAAGVPAVRFNPTSSSPVRTVFIHGVLASTSMWKQVVTGEMADRSAALP